jgi:hypothetical protein
MNQTQFYEKIPHLAAGDFFVTYLKPVVKINQTYQQ